MSTTVVGARLQPRHAEQLRSLAQRRGSTVSAVVADLVADAIDQEHRRQTADAAYETYWQKRWARVEDEWEPADNGRLEVNHKRIVLMAERLGVAKAMDVRFVSAERLGPHTLGQHSFDARGGRHEILIRSGLDPLEAQDTVWHEIGHACFAERIKSATLTELVGSDAVENDAERYAIELKGAQIVRLNSQRHER